MSGSPDDERPTPARLLFVHAHPDDETLTTGVTMASYAARGHDVHLLTCTLGEEGEVIPSDLAHRGPDCDDTLGSARREELRAAMRVVGVEHVVLGEHPAHGVASRYRDSGMAGTASARHPQAFARADLGDAAALVADHIKALKPDVVVTYDSHGGYDHPDHVQTHRVTMSALSSLAADAAAGAHAGAGAGAGSGAHAHTAATSAGPPVPVAYCILTPRSWALQDREWLLEQAATISPNCTVPQQDSLYPPSVVRDEVVTHVVDEPAMVETQSRALAEHRTQVTVHEGYYALSNHIAARLSGREGFAQFDPATGSLVPAAPGAPRHTGLLTDVQGHR